MILLLMAVTVGALLLVGHSIWPVAVLLNLWELLATAAPTGWWTWIARTLPENAEAGKGLMVAVIQLAIALDSTAERDFRHSGMAQFFEPEWFATSGSGSDDDCHIPSIQSSGLAQSIYFCCALCYGKGRKLNVFSSAITALVSLRTVRFAP